jgi:hypothetical protein
VALANGPEAIFGAFFRRSPPGPPRLLTAHDGLRHIASAGSANTPVPDSDNRSLWIGRW